LQTKHVEMGKEIGMKRENEKLVICEVYEE
jgi:hypothetical protein